MTPSQPPPARRYTFGKSLHLRSPKDFDRVYAARTAVRVGPLRVHAMPSETGHHRLGLSIGRRVGGAVRRNRVKRMLREAFRLDRHELPGAYDLVVVAEPHGAVELADYRRMLGDAVQRLHRTWRKRENASKAGKQENRKAGNEGDEAAAT